MCYKDVNTHYSSIKFVLECYKAQETCDKSVNRCFFHFYLIFPIGIEFSRCVAYPNRCKTHITYHKAVEDYLATLKFIPDWFDTSKMHENALFHNALFTNDDMLFLIKTLVKSRLLLINSMFWL